MLNFLTKRSIAFERAKVLVRKQVIPLFFYSFR
nr:MAG TPA: hypothetical protein [Caudoviricetes sp.]